jgi:DNA-binding winged helix-turn-helix (wHTH) protein
MVRFGDVELDGPRRELLRGGRPVHLEPQAVDLLAALIEHRDRVLSKIELLDGVWGHRFVSEANLTTRVKEIRRAVGDDGAHQHTIKNVRGRGYRFVAEVEVAVRWCLCGGVVRARQWRARHAGGGTIEMAAARLASMTFDELERAIVVGMPMPVTHRSPVRHHRSLDSMVAWSADLLDPPLRSAFTEFAAIAAAWTAAAPREASKGGGR